MESGNIYVFAVEQSGSTLVLRLVAPKPTEPDPRIAQPKEGFPRRDDADAWVDDADAWVEKAVEADLMGPGEPYRLMRCVGAEFDFEKVTVRRTR